MAGRKGELSKKDLGGREGGAPKLSVAGRQLGRASHGGREEELRGKRPGQRGASMAAC